MDYNIELIKMVLHLLNSKVKLLFNEETDDDFDDLIIAKHGQKKKTPLYQQVFQFKHGFIQPQYLRLIIQFGAPEFGILKESKSLILFPVQQC